MENFCNFVRVKFSTKFYYFCNKMEKEKYNWEFKQNVKELIDHEASKISWEKLIRIHKEVLQFSEP